GDRGGREEEEPEQRQPAAREGGVEVVREQPQEDQDEAGRDERDDREQTTHGRILALLPRGPFGRSRRRCRRRPSREAEPGGSTARAPARHARPRRSRSSPRPAAGSSRTGSACPGSG